MKTIYTAIIARLAEKVPALKWIEMDINQLSQAQPSVKFPCALVGIKLPKCKSITDTLQDCEARVSIRLAFDTQLRTASLVPEESREASLAVYGTIADVYAALQGWGTEHFNTLDRTSQGDEPAKNGLFIYKLEFSATFEDATAESLP
jgi:hypothetical protein